MEDLIEKQSLNLRRNIEDQINSINAFIEWSQRNLFASRRLEVFKKLVDKRRELKQKLFSLSSNPAIAAFGESQKGKSYVISNLLASKGKPFTVKDKDGKNYNFIEDMNPVTDNTEATGIVTRFTNNYKIIHEDFPIKLRMLSVADILAIFCDTYFHDVKNPVIFDKEDINEFMESIQKKYVDMPTVQHYIDEDDIFDIRDYIIQFFPSEKARELKDSNFFDVLAVIISKIQPKDWASVVSKLWSDNSDITSLFERILEGYEKISFSEEIYIPITAVLNSTTTLLGTDCLQLLATGGAVIGNSDLNLGTDIMICNNGNTSIIKGFNKSVLSAITAETIFEIERDAVNETLKYDLDGIQGEELKQYLLSHGWDKAVTKNFLQTNDILDFPGARSRLEIVAEKISMELCANNNMFLRGKVSYLFNKYSSAELINVLLFCHDHMQNATTVMPSILSNWINRVIGPTPKDREGVINTSIISPLFIIATKFNIDLAVKVANTNNRWTDRFDKVLYKQILSVSASDSWFNQWTLSSSFKNTYLLRDFKYSGSRGSNLFSGYTETGKEEDEYDKEFRAELKKTFLSDKNIGMFFDDPEIAWDSACTRNNDGSLRIIQNLSIVASHTKESRNYKYSKEIKAISTSVSLLMQEYYHDENEENILQKKISKCGSIIAELDVVCGKDNYFFGRMIQNLQISENQVFDFYYNILNGTKMIRESDLKEYDLILARCHGRITAENSFNENLEILRQEYHFVSTSECREFFEKDKGLDLYKLFECNFKQKSNSMQMAEGVILMWLTELSAPKNLKFYENHGCNTIAILDLIENMKAVVKEVGLANVIAKKISPFVDAFSVPHQILDMLADISAEMINDFVTSMGYNYYSKNKLEDLKALNEKSSLHLSFDYEDVGEIPMSDDELSSLFDDIRPTEENASKLGVLHSLPSFVNYNRWVDMVMISFIAAFGVPDYDIEANKILGVLLRTYSEIK